MGVSTSIVIVDFALPPFGYLIGAFVIIAIRKDRVPETNPIYNHSAFDDSYEGIVTFRVLIVTVIVIENNELASFEDAYFHNFMVFLSNYMVASIS